MSREWGWWLEIKLVRRGESKSHRGQLSRASYNQSGLCPAGNEAPMSFKHMSDTVRLAVIWHGLLQSEREDRPETLEATAQIQAGMSRAGATSVAVRVGLRGQADTRDGPTHRHTHVHPLQGPPPQDELGL